MVRNRALTCIFAALVGLVALVLPDSPPARAAPAAPATGAPPSASSTPTAAGTSAAAGSSDAAGQPSTPLDVKPLRVVILIDESGSLSDSDVAREKEAAQLLSVGELSPRSEITVLGFGSSNRPGQSPVDTLCPPTERSSPANQQALLDCIGTVHRRDPRDGNDTDHVAALNQALSILAQPDAQNRPPVIILLTDGVLDVQDSPSYGADPSQRNANAQSQLAETFAQARQNKVPIWPLGFGSGVNQQALDRFAAGGSQLTCNSRPSARPSAKIVRSSADVVENLVRIFASSRCAEVSDFGSSQLNSGSTVDIPVDVPDLSTDGSIVVLKGDPRVQVSYRDPGGTEVPRTGKVGDSTFAVSAENGLAESMHIINPRPGRWTVRLTAGADVQPSKVVAAVVWQGVVQSLIVVSPPSPAAGQEVAVRVRVRTRKGAITDAAQLRQLSFRASMEGEGVPVTSIALADNGSGPDTRAGDGEYAGTVSVPRSASGALTFAGVVDGPGIAPVPFQFDTRVAPGRPAVTATITPPRGTFRPGSTAAGSLLVNNVDGAPHRARLVLDQLDGRTLATLAGDNLITVPTAGQASFPVRIQLDPKTGLGTATGRLSLVDADNPNTIYVQSFFDVKVAKATSWPERFWWVFLLAGLLLAAIIAGVLAGLASRRRERDLAGVTIRLRRASTSSRSATSSRRPQTAPVQSIHASGTRVNTLRFTITQSGQDATLSSTVRGGAPAYVARRGRYGGIEVTAPAPEKRTFTLHLDRWEPVLDGFEMQYEESRRRSGTGRVGAGRSGASSSSGAGGRGGDSGSDERGRGSGDRGSRWDRSDRSGFSGSRPRGDDARGSDDRSRQQRRAAADGVGNAAGDTGVDRSTTMNVHDTTTWLPNGERARPRGETRGEESPDGPRGDDNRRGR